MICVRQTDLACNLCYLKKVVRQFVYVLSLFVCCNLCERFLSWWCCIFDWVLLLLLCDFDLSSKYIKYLFGGSFVLVLAKSFVEALWFLWICGVASLLWCGVGSLVPSWQFD